MHISLTEIKKPVAKEIESFELYFKKALKSNVTLLDIITNYIYKSKGKQMRPMFVFLCAKMIGEINERTYIGGTLIELLHTATLVHDDVVDNSLERRGFFSINALWKNKIAVLVGDFLLSKGLLISIENNANDLLKITSRAVQEMSEGELMQMEKARKLNITEEEYFTIIRKKTATLIASACATGAASVGADEKTIETFKTIGEHVGIAFQIKDDLLDFDMNDTGKTKGIDIKEKKLTLPIIYALKNSSYLEKRRILSIIKTKNKDKQTFNEIVQFIQEKGGIEYANKTMHFYTNIAKEMCLTLPESDANTALQQLIDYTITRIK
jgi:octaprenyl-diphosphate synthase